MVTGLTKDNLHVSPFSLFEEWFTQACAREICDPNAMALATATKDAVPSVRTVLMKGYDERGFVFYTNLDSRKGAEIKANPHAALCFHWKSLDRQVRIEGEVVPVSAEEADAYYASRPRGSRIGAWSSRQSRPLESRQELEARVAEFEKRFEGQDDIPRPANWSGFRVVPTRIEFWHAGESRLHDRFVYERLKDGSWKITRLYP